jgi:hypothetical protein
VSHAGVAMTSPSVRERPITFSTPLVKAMRAGNKTQTRRILKVPWKGRKRSMPYEPLYFEQRGKLMVDCSQEEWAAGEEDWREAIELLRCPYGAVGDLLWVRETWAYLTENGIRVVYRADADPPLSLIDKKPISPMRWNSSRFTPRAVSRITLRVMRIRIERLQAITEADAKAEGIESWVTRRARDFPCLSEQQTMTTGERMLDCPHRASFAVLWDEINGDRATWKSNPWVWAVDFEVHSVAAPKLP